MKPPGLVQPPGPMGRRGGEAEAKVPGGELPAETVLSETCHQLSTSATSTTTHTQLVLLTGEERETELPQGPGGVPMWQTGSRGLQARQVPPGGLQSPHPTCLISLWAPGVGGPLGAQTPGGGAWEPLSTVSKTGQESNTI